MPARIILIFTFIVLAVASFPVTAETGCEIIPLTDEIARDQNPVVDGGYIAWTTGVDGPGNITLHRVQGSITTTISDGRTVDYAPQIDAGVVVWQGFDGQRNDIYSYDISSKTLTNLTAERYANFDHYDPRIDGNWMTWYGSNGPGTGDIFYHNLKTGDFQRLRRDNTRDVTPRLGGSNIVWKSTNNDGTVKLRMLDAKSGAETVISDSPSGIFAVDGDRVVWSEWRDEYQNDLFVYDSASGQRTRITKDFDSSQYPDVNGHWITWESYGTNASTIQIYDMRSGESKTISDQSSYNLSPQVGSDFVVWETWDFFKGSTQVFLYNLTTGDIRALDGGEGNDFFPRTDADVIAWQSDRGTGKSRIYRATCGAAPVIEKQLDDIAVGTGSAITLNVVAQGMAPLYYQWYEGYSGDTSSPLGDNAPSFTTAPLYAPTQFWVQVRNDYGTTNSDTAEITVSAHLVNTIQQNGDFEIPKNGKIPEGWKGVTLANGDKHICNKTDRENGKPDKIVAHDGECAFQFKGAGGKNSKLKQIIRNDNVVKGDSLMLALWYSSKDLQAGAKAKLKVKYKNGSKDKLVLPLATGNTDYVEIATETLELQRKVNKVIILLQYKGASGKLFFDDVRLSHMETNPGTSSDDGLLPLPPSGALRDN